MSPKSSRKVLLKCACTRISHFWFAFCLCAAVSKQVWVKPFIRQKICFPYGSFSCKSNSFSCERFYTRSRFETEAQGNSEMTFWEDMTILQMLERTLKAENSLLWKEDNTFIRFIYLFIYFDVTSFRKSDINHTHLDVIILNRLEMV